jgi:pyrroline-5-carboxylate reductase
MTEQEALGGGHDFVRPFIMTSGRTRAERRDLRVETVLQAKVDAVPSGLYSEQEQVLRLCVEPQSVAEVAAKLKLVVGVVAVIASDLIAQELLDVHQTDPVEIELDMLTKMIERVRAI